MRLGGEPCLRREGNLGALAVSVDSVVGVAWLWAA